MATLYRKYRPQNFTEIFGQNHIKLTLEHEVTSNKLAHAYLFCGPRAIGKTTLARVLAKAVNCLERNSDSADPCNHCHACQEINDARSLDIIEIDAASHTGVDNVRENIIENARIMPASLKYKIFIIDEAHMLSTAAFNALLKIMEEPPQHVIFILCTTEVHKLPATIISRCQRFDFKKISLVDVVKKLSYISHEEEINIDKAILELIARHSQGHMRDAESLLGQIISVASPDDGSKKEITLEEAELVIPRSNLDEVVEFSANLVNKDAANAIKQINTLLSNGVDLKIFANDLIEIFRQILLSKINPDLISKLGLELGETIETRIGELKDKAEINWLIFAIERLIEAGRETKDSFIIQLPLELATVEICNFSKTIIAPITEKILPEQAIVKTIATKNNPISATKQVNKEELLTKWSEFLVKIRQYNHSLSFVLKVCEPQEIIDNKIILAFKYKLHKDRVNEPEIKKIVEQTLAEVYGAKLIIEAIVNENLVVENKYSPEPNLNNVNHEITSDNTKSNDQVNPNPVIDNLLKAFGGKVVG